MPAALAIVAIMGLSACQQEMILPGERFDTRAPLAATRGEGSDPNGLTAASDPAADAARAISLPAAQNIADWTSRGYNTRNRMPHAAFSTSPTEVWVTDIGDGNGRRARITADPVAAAGIVYTIDSDARLQATQISSGAAVWIADLTPDFDRGGAISGGNLAIAGGVVYATTGYGEVIALNAGSGQVAWRQRLGAVLGAPTISNGLVYVVGQNGAAWALEADDGRLRWQLPAPAAPSVLIGGPAPAISERFAILPFPSGEILGVFPNTGATIWGSFVAGGRPGAAYAAINDITSDPVVIGNTVYAGNQSGQVVALDANSGIRRWTAGEGAYSPILAAGGSLFFVSDRNELIRLEADTGDRIWGSELPLFVRERERRRKAVFTHFGPILAGGQLIVASGDGQIRFFSPESGALTATLPLRGGAASHPIVVDGTLMVVSADGRLHAFR